MASSSKHLSTHLYFHMERGHRQQAGRSGSSVSSGFRHSELQESPPPHRPRSWSKESERLEMEPPGPYAGEPPGSAYGTPVGGSPRHRGSILGSDWPEDYFSYSPYLLTPDLSKPRRHGGGARRHGAGRYELCGDEEDEFAPPAMEHPRLRPPDPASPMLDRRLLPPLPNGSRGKEGLEDPYRTSAYHDDYEQDCFIVPSHMKERFLPLKNEMNTLEVSDPKVCIIIDFRENSSFASQDLPFPSTALRLTPKEWLASQLSKQRQAFEWVKESQSAIEGILLMNVERHSQFPFVTYLVTNTIHCDPRRLIVQLRTQTAVSQNSEQLHHTAGYEEVASIVKPSLDCLTKCSVTSKTGFIISAFRVFPGEDREKLERNWLTWTGARQVYKCLPKHLGLRKLTFHKKLFPDGGITYVLMCECASLVDHVTEALVFVDHLRARCCGYTALYRPVDVF